MKSRLTRGTQGMKQASKRERRIRKDLKLIRGGIVKGQLYVDGKPLQFEIVGQTKASKTPEDGAK